MVYEIEERYPNEIYPCGSLCDVDFQFFQMKVIECLNLNDKKLILSILRKLNIDIDNFKNEDTKKLELFIPCIGMTLGEFCLYSYMINKINNKNHISHNNSSNFSYN